MLWTDRFTFLHNPKAAGKSLTRFFAEAWPAPVHAVLSRGQVRELADLPPGKVQHIDGNPHLELRRARDFLATRGVDIAAQQAVFVAVRNPYDLAVSQYFFMRANAAKGKVLHVSQIAADNDFEGYCLLKPFANPKAFLCYELDRKPANLRLLRFEHLQDDLASAARAFGFPMAPLPHLNRSERGDWRQYLTPAAEEAIHDKFRYLFEQGHYQRERP